MRPHDNLKDKQGTHGRWELSWGRTWHVRPGTRDTGLIWGQNERATRPLLLLPHQQFLPGRKHVESFDHHIPWGMMEDRTTKNTRLIKGTLQTTSELAHGDSDVCSQFDVDSTPARYLNLTHLRSVICDYHTFRPCPRKGKRVICNKVSWILFCDVNSAQLLIAESLKEWKFQLLSKFHNSHKIEYATVIKNADPDIHFLMWKELFQQVSEKAG